MDTAPRTDATGRILLEFQSVMEQFLDIERHVLGVYLSGKAGACQEIAADSDLFALTTGAPTRSPEPDEIALAREPVATPARTSVTRSDSPAIEESVKALRLTPRPVCRPAPGSRATVARDHAVLLTDDGRGICRRLAGRLRGAGHRVAIISLEDTADPSQGVYHSLLDSEAEVDRIVQLVVSQCGPIAALVHLLPLSPAPRFDDLDVAAWSHRLAAQTRTLFLLTKALRPLLEGAAGKGGAFVVAATAMGGAFGCDPPREDRSVFPGHGGTTGFMKCLSLEWPKVRAKTVDLDTTEPLAVLTDQIFDELWIDDQQPEIGYVSGNRVGLEITQVPASIAEGFAIPSDSVVLATGGARGITAEVCLELAERYQPTFVLVGQSRLPEPVEPQDTRSLTSPAGLKAALTHRLRAEEAQVTPALVEKAYQRLIKEREIRSNMSALVAAGSRVHYVPLDVRDDRAFSNLIDEIYATYGRIDGLIHGAGLIEDKLIQDKSVESFDRVFGTKTISAFVLSQRLKPESLRFALFFTSVAGRFGNRGQADYAAANEVVNKLARVLNQRWPHRVCALNWAPWDRTGMVSPELKREFKKRGVELLPPADGRRAFWEEIQQPPSDAPEIVIAGAAGMRLSAPAPTSVDTLPLLKHATRGSGTGSTVQYVRTLDPSVDRYLTDHRLDGLPVLPLAVATELMAEAAQATWPDLTVAAVRNLQLLKGIAVEASPVPMVITVRAPVHINEDGLTDADVEIATPSLTPATRYRAVVQLAPRLLQPPSFNVPDESLMPLPLSLEETYRQWTFHGPVFQRVTTIDGIGAHSMVGRMYSASERSAISGVARAGWLIDPFIFDAALQLLLIWSRAQNDKTALPSRFSALRRHSTLSDKPLTAYIQVEIIAGGHGLKSDVSFVDDGGRVIAVLEGIEASCTSALNRLAVGKDDVARAG